MRWPIRVNFVIGTIQMLSFAIVFGQSDPPTGVPRKLNVCETLQMASMCGDWIWNGHEFAFDYGKWAGTGTILRSGQSVSITRTDQKDPFLFRGVHAEYFGTFDTPHSGHGTVKWVINGRPPALGTWTATFGDIDSDKKDPNEPLALPPPPSDGTPTMPIPVGLEVCDGGCITNSDKNVGTWIFRGKKGDGRWPKGGQSASLTIDRFDINGVIIRREDRPDSSDPGLTAVYQGTIHDGRIDGTATLKWPGHLREAGPSGVVHITWYGTVPATTCASSGDVSAEEALESGGKAARFRQMPSAFHCFEIAAKLGDGQAKALVGIMYRDGIGTDVDYGAALKWLNAAAIQGDYNAEVALGQVYEMGIGTKPDAELAKRWKAQAESNPMIVQQRQQRQDQKEMQGMMFMGLAAVLESAMSPSVYVVR